MSSLARACGAGLVAALLLARGDVPARSADAPPELWFWYGVNLADAASLTRLEGVWRRAAAAGYRHVMLSDPKFARLDRMDQRYFENVKRVKALASSIGLEIVPGLFTVGRANGELSHDPNLAEGLPVRDAPFEVRGGVAVPLTDPPVVLPARPEFADPDVRVDQGVATIRDNRSRARFHFTVAVAPRRCYHLSVLIRTDGWSGEPLVQVMAGGRAIHFLRSLGVKSTQDWTRHDVVFNSRGNSEIELWLGAWKPAHGTLEWKGWKLEEPGPLNIVRRTGAPFTASADPSAPATAGPREAIEGRDLDPVSDPLLGRTPGAGDYTGWHEPPVLRTHLPDGTRLRCSWTMAAIVYDRQVALCLSDSGTMALLADEAERVRAAFTAQGYLMMHDEIRALGGDDACTRRGLSPGQILAQNARDCARLLSGAHVYVWNDMFDPYQNAISGYHLVDGDLSEAWRGLDSSVVVVNWDGDHKEESLRFFADRGHPQIIAGYYDGRVEDVRAWLEAASRVRGVTGVMYTTWRDRYDDLEAFAQAVRAYH